MYTVSRCEVLIRRSKRCSSLLTFPTFLGRPGPRFCLLHAGLNDAVRTEQESLVIIHNLAATYGVTNHEQWKMIPSPMLKLPRIDVCRCSTITFALAIRRQVYVYTWWNAIALIQHMPNIRIRSLIWSQISFLG